MADPHILRQGVKWPFRILLIGCGGNGAQMLSGLASLDHALKAMGDRSLHVTTVDDDIVSEANIGRQPFYPCDIGRHKAIVLTERINIAYGLEWTALVKRLTAGTLTDPHARYEMVISCVDTAAARRDIGHVIEQQACYRALRNVYWMDLGNRATDGQIVLGQILHDKDTRSRNNPALHQARLPTVLERFPELTDESIPEDNTPSCSLAEALTKQSLFINRTLAGHALAMLYDLLINGCVSHAGLFLNVSSGLAMPIALPENPTVRPRKRTRKTKTEPTPHATAPAAA